MLEKKVILYTIIILLILPALAFSQLQEVKEYTVIQGDTLWDISSGELNDPFLWPKVWKENPEIINPDLIYPDQIIRIPLYLIQEVEHEEPVAMPEPVPIPEPVEEIEEVAEPVKPEYLIDRNLLLASSYIDDSVEGVGKIIGAPSGRSLFGNNDLVYVETDNPVDVGDKFYIIRGGEKVEHPETGKIVGYVIEMLGIAEIDKFEYGQTIAKIIQSFKDITIDDLLDTYYEIEPPLAAEDYRRPYIDGYVLATQDLRILIGSFDIVFIDKGRNDGIEIGDLLKTVDIGKHKIPNGIIQIINYRDATATAIVRKSKDAITTGNVFTHLE